MKQLWNNIRRCMERINMAIYANSRWYEFLKEAKDSKSNSKKTHES